MKRNIKLYFKKLIHNYSAWLILLVAWIIFSGKITVMNIAVGLIVCSLPILIFPEIFTAIISLNAFKRLPFLFIFLLYMLLEIFLACFRMAYFTLNPKVNLQSSIFVYEYSLKNSAAVFFLATVITLTPGTLVLDIAKTEDKLYIHAMDHFSKSKEDVISNVRLFEQWLRRIFE